MKTIQTIIGGLLLTLFFASCDRGEESLLPELPSVQPPSEETPAVLPDGYFEVTFAPQYGTDTRAPITGSDTRVRSLRYVIYKSTGEYVKEKVVLKTTDPVPVWPLAAMKDTLPKGQYTAVFLANVDKTQFPIPGTGGTTTYNDILTNYQTTRANARINLPGSEFTDNSEFYYTSVVFSDASPQPNVLLQRIITMLNLRRVFVDAQKALDSLVDNIVTQIGYRNIIKTTVEGLLPGLLKPALDLGPVGNQVYDVAVGGLDAAVNLLVGVLVEPVTDALYNILLQQLVNQIGLTLSGNASQNGALGALGSLLNPWRGSDAAYALVTINNFPKAMDLNLNVTDTYTGLHRFRYGFTTTPGTTNSEKDILIRGFHGLFDVRKIEVAKPGLISGVLVDQVLDGSLLLNGTFVNITDPIQATVNTNFRYRSNYSFVSLGLKSYTQQTDGNHSLTLSVQLKNIANLDGILTGVPVLGPLLNGAVKALIGNITVSVPVNLPLLGADNLSLSGSWQTPPVQY